MEILNINLDQTMRNTEALNHIFQNIGYIPKKPQKMVLNEIQLDEIEKAYQDTDDYTTLDKLLQQATNIKSVARSFLSYANDLESEIYEKRELIEEKEAQLKREQENV